MNGCLEERDEEDVGCLLAADPPRLLPKGFLEEEEIEEEVRMEEDLAGGGGGFLAPCLVVLGCLSLGSLDALVERGGRVADAGGRALLGRGRRPGGVCASLLEPEREAAAERRS